MNNLFGGNNFIWIILLLFLFGQNNGGIFNFGSDNTMFLIVIALLVFTQGGNFLCCDDMK